jgi:hypothetical protein
MRLLRDSFPFGAIFGAPLVAVWKELVLPFLGGLSAVVLVCWAGRSVLVRGKRS